MAGVELATGYVSLVPSAQDISSLIAKEMGAPLERAAKESGERASDGFASAFSSKLKVGIGAIGVGLGAALTKGFGDSVSFEVTSDKLAAQLGLSAQQSKDLGQVAGSLYADAYGGSLGEVNAALRSVLQDGLVFEDSSKEQIEGVTAKVLDLASAFDTDLGAVTRGVGQMLRTGMARDADEALDIITRGFQQGVDKSGDFLDTLNEYGTQFRKLGLDGTTATALLSQGLRAGARDADIVADSIKEFSIRAVDGSTLTAESFKALGLNAKDMTAAIAAGGPTASAALGTVLEKLRGVEDPAQRAQIAVGLFGTQAEDMGDALFALDLSQASLELGNVAGAADKMGATLADNTGTKLEAFRRKFELAFAGLGDKLGPVLAVAPGIAGLVTAASGLGLPLTQVATGLAGVAKSAALGTVSLVKNTAATVASRTAQVAAAAASKVWAAAQWALNAALAANPITLIVIALVALVAGLVLAYNKVEWFRDAVNAALGFVRDVAVGVFEWIRDNWPLLLAILAGPFGLAVFAIAKHWDTIKAAAQAAWEFVVGIVETAIAAVVAVVTTGGQLIATVVTGAWNTVRTVIETAMAAIRLVIETGWAIITTVVDTAIGAVRTVIETQLAVISAVWGAVWAGVQAVIGTVFGAITAFVDNQVRGWSVIIQTGLDIILGIFDAVLAGIRFVVDTALSGIADAFAWVRMVIETHVAAVRAVIDEVGGFIGGTKDFIVESTTRIAQGFDDMVEWALRKLRELLNWVKANADKILGPLDEIAGIAGKVGGGIAGAVKKIPGLAAGGYTPSGGPVWVGEQGPELRYSNRRDFIADHRSSMEILAGRGNRGGVSIETLIVQTQDPPRQFFDEGLWRVGVGF